MANKKPCASGKHKQGLKSEPAEVQMKVIFGLH